jgi:hypothetical protein
MKRYDVAPHGSTEDMTPSASGDWVLFEDVERVASLVAKMRADWRLSADSTIASWASRLSMCANTSKTWRPRSVRGLTFELSRPKGRLERPVRALADEATKGDAP